MAQKVKRKQIERNQEQILCMLTRLVSDMSEMKRSSEIKIDHIQDDNLTSLDAEQHKQEQILATLTNWVSDMRKMKRLKTEPPEIKIPPLDIQEEIMKRLPVESLVRFRCVSKSWKSLIESSEFIASHRNQPKHLLVEYSETRNGDLKYVSFADNDSFPRLREFRVLPWSLYRPRMIGTSYGLLCLRCYDSEMAAIWNPCIRKSIAIFMPSEKFSDDYTHIGFGVCPVTLDPKIVHITHLCPPQARREESKFRKQLGKFWNVNVYKLSSGIFRNLFSNLPCVSVRIETSSAQVVIDRLIYWCAEEDGTNARSLIMSFDITDEKFKEVDLPRSLATLKINYLSVNF